MKEDGLIFFTQFCLVHTCEVNANARAVQAMFTRIANVNASVRNRTSTHAHLEWFSKMANRALQSLPFAFVSSVHT